MTFKQSLKLVREVAVQNMEKCVLGRRNSHARTLRQEHANPLEAMLKSVCLEQGRLGRLVRWPWRSYRGLACARLLLWSGFSASRLRGRIRCAGHLLESAVRIKTCGKECKEVG